MNVRCITWALCLIGKIGNLNSMDVHDSFLILESLINPIQIENLNSTFVGYKYPLEDQVFNITHSYT